MGDHKPPDLIFTGSDLAASRNGPSGLTVNERTAGALWGMHVGDSLAFPMHWYYNAAQLKADLDEHYGGGFFELTRVKTELRFKHPDSWKYYQKYGTPLPSIHHQENIEQLAKTPGLHYHPFLLQGENTITMRIANIIVSSIVTECNTSGGRTKLEGWFSKYVRGYEDFFLKPGNHNDTYVEAVHRAYFNRRLAQLVSTDVNQPLKEIRNLSGSSSSAPLEAQLNDSCLSGVVLSLPILFLRHQSFLGTSEEAAIAIKEVRELLRITHGTPDSLLKPIEILGKLIAELLHLTDLKEEDVATVSSGDALELTQYPEDKQMILHAMDAIQRAYNAISASGCFDAEFGQKPLTEDDDLMQYIDIPNESLFLLQQQLPQFQPKFSVR